MWSIQQLIKVKCELSLHQAPHEGCTPHPHQNPWNLRLFTASRLIKHFINVNNDQDFNTLLIDFYIIVLFSHLIKLYSLQLN